MVQNSAETLGRRMRERRLLRLFVSFTGSTLCSRSSCSRSVISGRQYKTAIQVVQWTWKRFPSTTSTALPDELWEKSLRIQLWNALPRNVRSEQEIGPLDKDKNFAAQWVPWTEEEGAFNYLSVVWHCIQAPLYRDEQVFNPLYSPH